MRTEMIRIVDRDMEEEEITLEQALGKVADLAVEIGGQHELLGAALGLIVRCAPLARGIQHRLLTASAAMVEMAGWGKAAA